MALITDNQFYKNCKMKKLVQLFIEQKVEKRLFASFGSNKEKEVTDKDLEEILKEPEVKIILDSGVNLEELKTMYFEALDKAYAKLKEKQDEKIKKVFEYLRKHKKIA